MGNSLFSSTVTVDDSAIEPLTCFYNGTVLTMDANETIGIGMVISGNRIIQILTTPEEVELAKLKGTGVDLAGKTILPGFILSHMHVNTYANLKEQISVSAWNLFFQPDYIAPKTSAEVLIKIGQEAERSGASPVVAIGYDPVLQSGSIITRVDLDRICPARPLYLMGASLHDLYVNTQALVVSGLVQTILPDGKLILSDRVPIQYRISVQTGCLSEHGMQLLSGSLPTASYDQMLLNLQAIGTTLNSRGITTVGDAGVSDTIFPLYRDYSRLRPDFRIVGFPLYTPNSPFLTVGHGSFVQPNMAEYLTNDFLRIGPVKVIGDGSIEGYTAYLTQPYITSPYFRVPDSADWCGELEFSVPYFEKALELIFRSKMDLAIHANGDGCIDMVLEVYARMQKLYPGDWRPRIEHCTMVRSDQLDRMRDLDMLPSFLANHIYYYGDVMVDRLIGAERADRIDPMGEVVRKGMKCDLHSDSPVTPPDPLKLISIAVNRLTQSGQCLGSDQKVSVMDGLKMMTCHSAYSLRQEESIGSLDPGKLADFIILSQNPVTHLDTTTIVSTYVNGELRWSA